MRGAQVAVRELGAIDNAAYRSINRTNTLNALVHLRRLRDLGLLVMKGSGNRTYYEPGANFDGAPQTHQPEPETRQPWPQTHPMSIAETALAAMTHPRP